MGHVLRSSFKVLESFRKKPQVLGYSTLLFIILKRLKIVKKLASQTFRHSVETKVIIEGECLNSLVTQIPTTAILRI